MSDVLSLILKNLKNNVMNNSTREKNMKNIIKNGREVYIHRKKTYVS